LAVWQSFRAHRRRRGLGKVTFIGVTGSCGKTTTTQLVGAVLSTAGECHVSSGLNGYEQVVDSILSMGSATKYCVQEVSGSWPGRVRPQVELLQPLIGVVTTVGTDHYKRYRTREAVALEKGQLVESLPEAGTAILNADDPYVLSMKERTRARVLTVGTDMESDFRALEVRSVWPERLSLTVAYRGQTFELATHLVGNWWTTSILSTLACGIACGLDLKICIKAIEAFEPPLGRYSVHETPRGASYLLDHKAPVWTVPQAIAFVGAARAERRTIVFGTVSDYPGACAPRYRRIAREALASVDRVIFVGPHAGHVSKLAHGPLRERLFSFHTAYEASQFLRQTTVPGELILLKGSTRVDHLERIVLSQLDDVVCWKESCGKVKFCPGCKRYRRPSTPYALSAAYDKAALTGPAPESYEPAAKLRT
jgi:UDP-N-acetylmuramyl pentapeptide synthase